MKFYRNLYVSEGLQKKKEKIIKKLQMGKLQRNLQLITLAVNPSNHLEIYSSMLLLQPLFPKKNIFIVGIVKDYGEALEFVEDLTQKVYNETGRIDIRSYILEKEQDG